MTAMRGLMVLLGIAALAMVVQEARLHGAERRAVTASLVRDSLDAVHDTTRLVEVVASGEAVSGDSAKVWERRAIQATQRADALDRALGEARVARAEVGLSSPRIDTVVAVPTPGTTEVIRQAPFTVSIEEAPKGSSDSGAVLGLHVVADTMLLGVRIGCGTAGRLGVRPASVSVSAPSWASVTLDRVEQDPSVCNATVSGVASAGVIRRLLGRVGVTVGYSALVVGGVVVTRPTVGVGFRVWP